MAEAFLSVLLENLNSLVQRRIGLLLGVDNEMKKFSSILSTISAVLEDAEEKQLTDRAIKNWLQKLNDISLELDDVLDDCESEAFRLDYDGQKLKWSQKVRSSLSCLVNPKNALFRYKIAKKMKEIGDRLDEIANERMKFHLREVVGERRDHGFRERRETSSIITEPHVYGREQDKEKVVGFLVNDAMTCEDLSIYPIVGLGGMGKTTLAQLVFNDVRVGKHFELKMWVCVSEDFDVKRLVKEITESATRKKCDELHMDPLQKQLQEILKMKRFLLVLDDVWNEAEDQWDKLKYVLACGSKGSSIVVTTRLKNVASFMGTVPMHPLSGLSEADCSLLFEQRAFGNEREEWPNLVKIGKEMVSKCKGVPLAAKALGGLLRFKREEHEWVSVMQSELWNLPQDKSSILPALRLSYFHLPIEQRRCFAFCAVFPKDYRIERERLIHLWMANGLISSKRGLDVEDVGDEIINELYWRSLIQDIEKDVFDDVSHFKMHDLVHDLAQSVMEDECRFVEANENTRPIDLLRRVHHLTCLPSHQSESVTVDIPSAQSLRTFMGLSNGFTNCSYNLKFSSLRAFDAGLFWPSTPIRALISNFKHIRYLSISSNTIKILPESVCFLNHLLTLDLRLWSSLHKLPNHMSRLKSLRHLYLSPWNVLNCMPPNIGKLTCLRTLTNFVVSRRKGCRLDELCNLNIGGSLRINNLEKVGSPAEAISANLSGKRNLKELELSWSGNENESENKAEQVLEVLVPSPNLKSLSLYGYKGIRFPYWFSNESLGNVVRITLSNCKNCSELSPFGKLPLLQDLRISGMNFVQYMDNESYNGDLRRGFACLKTLQLQDLPNLERLSREEGKEMFPCLSSLRVEKCPKLTLPDLESVKRLTVYEGSELLLKSISHLPGLTHLDIRGNDELTFFPEGVLQNLTVLHSLQIFGFTKLQELPPDMLIALSALEDLEIGFCDELRCLPERLPLKGPSLLKRMTIMGCKKLKSLSDSFRDLTALQSLRLVGCPELEEFPSCLHRLSSLQSLTMSGVEIKMSGHGGLSFQFRESHKLAALPEALQDLPSLEVMTISYFLELTSWPDWLGNLASLREFCIIGCPDLTYIPTSIKNLSNLQKLTIESCCPNLERRCEREVGEDWHKISHIPDVYVGPERWPPTCWIWLTTKNTPFTKGQDC